MFRLIGGAVVWGFAIYGFKVWLDGRREAEARWERGG